MNYFLDFSGHWPQLSLTGLIPIPNIFLLTPYPEPISQYGTIWRSFDSLTWMLWILCTIMLTSALFFAYLLYQETELRKLMNFYRTDMWDLLGLQTFSAMTEVTRLQKWFHIGSGGKNTQAFSFFICN